MAQKIDFTPEPERIDFTPIDFTPSSDEPDFVELAPEDDSDGLLGSLTQPLFTFPQELASSIAGKIDAPSLERGRIPAMVRGFGAGALEGLGGLVSGLTSPLDLGLALTTGGAATAARKGLTGASRALGGATRAGGGLVGVEGAHRILTAEDPIDVGTGLLEVAGGIAGMAMPVTKPRVKIQPKEDVLYHGSPAQFDAFDLAQPERSRGAHGHGVALAEEIGEAIPYADDSGYLHRTQLKAPRDEFLDLDASLGEQSASVQLRLDGLDLDLVPEDTGADVINALKRKFETEGIPRDQLNRKVSEILKQEGIKGTVYLDDLSKRDLTNSAEVTRRLIKETRGAERKAHQEYLKRLEQRGEGQFRNYSVFDPKDVEIIGSTKVADIEILPSEVVDSMPPANKLLQALEEAQPLTDKQKALLAVERAKKAAAAEGVTIRTEEDAAKFLTRLRGEHSKVAFEGVRAKLNQADVDDLFNTIGRSDLTTFERARASKALFKVLDGGEVPQQNELSLLERVFGSDMRRSLEHRMPTIDRGRGLLAEAINLPRGLMASMDLSAPFRQGLGFVHRREFWKSFDDMFRGLGSEDGYRAVRESVEASPNFDLARESKLALTDLLSLRDREEAIMSTWAERIPGIGRAVRASNRAYVSFLNKVRMDVFDSLVADAQRLGRDPNTDRVLSNALASFVNTATGRGHLGPLERHAVLLNSTFFSPRMIASRVRMLNPNYYIQADPLIRKEALKSLFSIAAFGSSLVTLGELAGGEVEKDPRSSDFGKLRIGNTRLDPYGGFQQYIVAASRLLSGETKSPVTGRTTDLTSGRFGQPTRKDIIQRFGESKLHPVLGFVETMIEGKDFRGQPAVVSDEVRNLFTPILIQDLIELAQEEPELIPLVIPPAALGMGSQTFGNR